MTCRHCQHAIQRRSLTAAGQLVLWCRMHRMPATAPCASFCREPGADDDL
jgi:hypothetical protein